MPTYPYPAPTVNGTQITVEAFLQNPTRVQRAIDELANNRFITDVIFQQGPAVQGGAVLYDQVVGPETSFTDQDVQEIEPGSEFPILGTGELMPLVAVSRKYGGEVMLTDEAVRRDRRDLLARNTTRLRNTIIRKVDTVAISALEAAPILSYVGADWGTAATDILAELASAAFESTSLDMGYSPDTVLINPAQELDLLKDTDIRTALANSGDASIIRQGLVGTLMGFTFITSSRVEAGTAYLLERRTAGSVSDEVPLYARPLHDDRRETWFIHGGRVAVPFVTDPKAVVKLTGI
jgi:hypothetical protein